MFPILLSSDTLSVLFLVASVEASHHYRITGKTTDHQFFFWYFCRLERLVLYLRFWYKILIAIPNELWYQYTSSRYPGGTWRFAGLSVWLSSKFLWSQRRRSSLRITYKRPGEQVVLLNCATIRCRKGHRCGVRGHRRCTAAQCSLLGWDEWEMAKDLGTAVIRMNDDCEIWGAGGSVDGRFKSSVMSVTA